MTEILVRKARRDEAKTIADLLSRCQWFTYGKLFSDAYIERLIEKYYNVERIKQEVTTVDKSWHGYIVAEQDGNIIGVIGGGMTDATNGEIYVFYVDPDSRGAGIGSRLLDFYTKVQKHTYGARTAMGFSSKRQSVWNSFLRSERIFIRPRRDFIWSD